MSENSAPVDCYLGSFSRQLEETYLQDNGFSRGMIMFAIPCHGVLFKCRAEGNLLDLEFGAFFSLLRFVKTSLVKEKIKAVRVHSSNPVFVYSILNEGSLLKSRRRRYNMFRQYMSQFNIEVALVPARRNQAFTPPLDFPSIPKNQTPPLKPRAADNQRVRFRPIQKGIIV